MTPAQRMREYREKLKQNPEVYQRYKQMNAMRSRLARLRRSQEQVERDREKARARNQKYRVPGQVNVKLSPADVGLMDLSSASFLAPTHLLHQPPAQLSLPVLSFPNPNVSQSLGLVSPSVSPSIPHFLSEANRARASPLPSNQSCISGADPSAEDPVSSRESPSQSSEKPMVGEVVFPSSSSAEEWEPPVIFQSPSSTSTS